MYDSIMDQPLRKEEIIATSSIEAVKNNEESKEYFKLSSDRPEANLLSPQMMRRVDWRWAVAKGFLNKETNQWNEQLGGKDAYLKQRNERMLARSA